MFMFLLVESGRNEKGRMTEVTAILP